MVDREARHSASAALRRFADGETTNDEFEFEYPDASKSHDRAIRAVDTMIWNLYSDEVHRLTGTHAPDTEGRSLLQRCLLFLSSGKEYAWPVDNFIAVRGADPILNALTFGATGRRKERHFQKMMDELAAAGDFSTWPFVSGEELAAAERR